MAADDQETISIEEFSLLKETQCPMPPRKYSYETGKKDKPIDTIKQQHGIIKIISG